MKHLFSLFFVFWGLFAFGQSSKVTISGTLTDAKTGEELIGATVFDTNKRLGLAPTFTAFTALQ